MAARSRKALGLAVGARSVVVAEVHIGGGRREVTRFGEYIFPQGQSWDDPTPLGRGLAQFLRHERFSTRQAVFGLPTDWLLAREKSVPPATAEVLAGLLQIQAERDFATDAKELALDYAGQPDQTKGRAVLMVATLRRRLEQVITAAESAGLAPAAVTSSAMVLSDAGRTEGSCGVVLSLKPDSAELTIQTGDQFHLLRHLTAPARPADGGADESGWVTTLASEMRRAMTALPEAGGPPSLMVWNGAAHASKSASAIGAQLGIPSCVGDARSVLGFTAMPAGAESLGARMDQAAALGLAGIDTRRLPVDFLHSRLAPKRKPFLGQRAVAALAVGIIVLGAIGYVVYDWYGGAQQVSSLKLQLAGTKDQVGSAKDLLSKYGQAREWYDQRPRMLDSMKDITAAFPQEGRIWVTNLSLRPPRVAAEKGLQGLVSGKAQDEKVVIETMDKMMRSKAFGDVKRLYIREAARGSRDVSFAFSFSYLGTE